MQVYLQYTLQYTASPLQHTITMALPCLLLFCYCHVCFDLLLSKACRLQPEQHRMSKQCVGIDWSKMSGKCTCCHAVFICYAMDKDTHSVTNAEVHEVFSQVRSLSGTFPALCTVYAGLTVC